MFDFSKHFANRVARFERECARFKRSGRGQEGVVFLGDSLVERYKGPLPWVNRGISSDHLQWPEIDIFDRLGSDRLHPNPGAIVTLVGINDLNDAPHDVERPVNAYRFLLANLAQIHPRARIAVCSLLPTCGPAGHLNPGIAEFNRQLADVAALSGAAFLDLHERFVDPATGLARGGFLLEDGLHVSRRGYAELSAFVERHAAALGLSAGAGQGGPVPFRRRTIRAAVARAWHVVRPEAAGHDAISEPERARMADRLLAEYGSDRWSRDGASLDAASARALVRVEVDFVSRYVATGRPLFRDLYLGARAGFFARNPDLWSEHADGMRAGFDRDRGVWLDALQANGDARPRFDQAFAELRTMVPAAAPQQVRLLFVGDCLLEDVELLINGQLTRQGLLAQAEFVLSKNPMEQVRQIRERGRERFDGVVYSPLSWEFDPEFGNFLTPGLRSRRALMHDVESIWARVASTVRLLADTFEAPVYVHNTAAVVRASSEVRRVAKALVTYPQRALARRQFAQRIDALLADINASSFHHMVLVYERAAVRGLRDDLTLGRMPYYSAAVHPAELSAEAAGTLAAYVAASARFVGKKVVVCDLDNTLWDGAIGEGSGVRHQRRRQRTLQRLKQKGVLLAISSKNDPANVRWDSSVLTADDFVAAEISWNPKPAGIQKIQEALNLKVKDFVFIDDRSDERAMATGELPTLTAVDPCLEETWATFDAWATLLGNDEGDRTQLYRARAEREMALTGQAETQAAADLFQKLQLSLDIRRASTDDLKRVHELINRTNQWNLQGSRCTFGDVKAWHESPRHIVYTARVADKYGDMGLVCCCVAEFGERALMVPVFVLSCRVFGYGVETMILERLKEDAAVRFGVPRVQGVFVETPHNKLCRSMYAEHGFVLEGDAWVSPGGNVSAADPVWFRPAAMA